MARLGRGRPIQPRLARIPPAASSPAAGGMQGTGTAAAAGTKAGQGSAAAAGTSAAAPAGVSARQGSAVWSGTVLASGPTQLTATLTGMWQAAATADPAAAGVPAPAAVSLPVQIENIAGRWLIAVVAWRQAPGYPAVTFHVGDDAHNWWDPMGAPGGTSNASGTVRTAVWRAPAARAATLVTAAPTGYVTSAVIQILEFDGPLPWVAETPTSTAYVNDGTSLPSLSAAAQPAAAVQITACAWDAGQQPAGPGSGWNALPPAAVSNGADHTGDLAVAAAWQYTPSSVTAAWAPAAATDAAAILTGFSGSAAAPATPSQQWAAVFFELAPGAGYGTPADEITWVQPESGDVPARFLGWSFAQGQQYEVGTLQAGTGTAVLGNEDLAFVPPGLGEFAGIDSGTPWRLRLAWPGGGPYPVNPTPWAVAGAGYLERLPPTWTSGTRRGVIQSTIVDAWAYCQDELNSCMREEVAADNPVFSWPMDDPSGAVAAANRAPGNPAPLLQVASRYGTATATAAFGASAGALAGAGSASTPGTGAATYAVPGTVWGQTGMPATATSTGTCLYCESTGFPSLTAAAGLTIEAWAQITGPTYQTAVIWAIKSTTGPVMALTCDTSGLLWLTTWTPAGAAATTQISDVNWIGTPAMFQTALTWTPAAGWTAYLNGAQAAASAAAPSVPPSFTWISFGGQSDRFASGGMFNGQIAEGHVFAAALPAARIAAHYQAGYAALAAEPYPSRVERILLAAGHTGRRVIETAPAAASTDLCSSASDWPQKQAGQALSDLVASASPAMLYVAPTGDIYSHVKARAFGEPVKWVLGEDTSAGEIPLVPGTAFGWDPARVLDLIEITQLDRQDVVTPQVQAAEAAATAKYGQNVDEITGYLYNDLTTPLTAASPSSLIDLANWLAVTNAAPHLRVAQATVDAARYPQAWPLVAAVSPGDMATVHARPITAQAPITVTGRITRVERKIAYGMKRTAAQARLSIDFCPEASPLTLGDPVLGQIDGTHVLTW